MPLASRYHAEILYWSYLQVNLAGDITDQLGRMIYDSGSAGKGAAKNEPESVTSLPV